MRVLQLGPWPPPQGGVQTNLVAIREYLLRSGHECPVINLHRHRTGREHGVYHPENAAETARLLLRLKYDIAHLHLGGDVSRRLTALAAVLAMRPRVKSVLTFHSGGYATSPAGRSASPRSVLGAVFRRFDAIIAVNREIEALFHRFGVPAGRVHLIYPYALPSEPPRGPLPEAIERFFATHSPVLVTVGLLEPEYDLPLQIEAMSRIVAGHPGAGLLIVGSGSLEQELRNLIAAQPCSRHILLCGDVPRNATLHAMWKAGAFLRTTLYDGDSVSVREALHIGVPVIATDNGMRPEGVLLMPVGDQNALIELVDRVVRDKRPRETANADPEENLRAVLQLYENLLQGRRPAAPERSRAIAEPPAMG